MQAYLMKIMIPQFNESVLLKLTSCSVILKEGVAQISHLFHYVLFSKCDVTVGCSNLSRTVKDLFTLSC